MSSDISIPNASRAELIARIYEYNVLEHLTNDQFNDLLDLLVQFVEPADYVHLINVGWNRFIMKHPFPMTTDAYSILSKFFSIKNINNDPDVYRKFLIIIRTCLKHKYRKNSQLQIADDEEIELEQETREILNDEDSEQTVKKFRLHDGSSVDVEMSTDKETTKSDTKMECGDEETEHNELNNEMESAQMLNMLRFHEIYRAGTSPDTETDREIRANDKNDMVSNVEPVKSCGKEYVSIMKYAMLIGDLRMIHCINKYTGSKITFDKNKFDQCAIDINYIKYAFIDQKLSNAKLLNALFNRKIINLKWIGKRYGNVELQEFTDKFQKVLQCIIEMFHRKNSEEIKNAINMNFIKIIHISIFDMFDSCDKAVLKKIVINKCHEFFLLINLPDNNTVSVSDVHDQWFDERCEDIHNIFQFYSNICKNNLEGTIKYMDLCSKITNYDWTENDFLPIYIAIQQNACEIIQKLIYRRNVNTNLTDYQNSTILHWTMKFPKLFETIKECIEGCTYYNNNINAKNDLSRKPLYYAIKYNNYDAFEYCTQIRPRKRKLNDELDIFEKSYFVLAAKYGRFDIFNELMTFIQPNETYFYTLRSMCVTGYFSLLSIVVDQRQTKICIQLLQSNPATSNEKFVLGITPLTIAALNGDPDLMLKLLANDASITANIQNDIYIGNIDEEMQQKYIEQGKSKDATLFDSNRFNDNLFEFVCSSFSENKQHNLSGDKLSVMKIFISQLILHGKDIQLPDTMNEDDISILMEHKTICNEELNENGEDMISDLYTIRDFLKCSLSESEIKIKACLKERKVNVLIELKRKIGKLNAYKLLGLEKIAFLFKEY